MMSRRNFRLAQAVVLQDVVRRALVSIRVEDRAGEIHLEEEDRAVGGHPEIQARVPLAGEPRKDGGGSRPQARIEVRIGAGHVALGVKRGDLERVGLEAVSLGKPELDRYKHQGRLCRVGLCGNQYRKLGAIHVLLDEHPAVVVNARRRLLPERGPIRHERPFVHAHAVAVRRGLHEEGIAQVRHRRRDALRAIDDGVGRDGDTRCACDQRHHVLGRVVQRARGPGERQVHVFEGMNDVDRGLVRIAVAFTEVHVDVEALPLERPDLAERGDLVEELVVEDVFRQERREIPRGIVVLVVAGRTTVRGLEDAGPHA